MFAAKNELFTRPSGGFVIPRSLRFRASASSYLAKTFGTAPTSGTTQTRSFWFKRGRLTGAQSIWTEYDGGTNAVYLYFSGSNDLTAQVSFGGTGYVIATNAVFRDPSAWYHIVHVLDSTAATSTNRNIIYVNGVLQTLQGGGTYVPQNSATALTSSGRPCEIGVYDNLSLQFLDGYMAEFNLIDGQALTPSSFGATSTTTGVWSPIKYGGTYGNNGFHLDFNSYATQAALGTDTSGNGNTFTVNNCSVTAGVTYDSMIDVPTVTDTGSNYCVISPIDENFTTATAVVSDGNLKFALSTTPANQQACRGTQAQTAKFYFEVITLSVGAGLAFGIKTTGATLTSSGGLQAADAWEILGSNGNKWNVSSTAYGSAYTTNDIGMCAVDPANGKIWFGKNGTWFASGDPAAGTNAAFTNVVSSVQPLFECGTSTDSIAANFGQRPFTYTPPSGFSALNTYNLAAPSILKGNLYMDATTYTGTGASLNVTNAGGFQPDLVWTKSRSAATDNKLTDSVRGVTKALISNSSAVESTDTQGLTAFNTGGFTVGTNTDYNNLAATYVGWQWKGGGAAVTNTNGTMSTQVSASAASGFSVCRFTTPSGTVNPNTFGHGLGVAPSFVITKSIALAQSYDTYHVGTGNTVRMLLNTTAAASSANAQYWNNTTPSSTVVTIGTTTWWGSSVDYIAYCFTPVAGFSAFGSYTGNGSADGPFVYLGFRPRWLMLKRSSTASVTYGWQLYDTSRSPYNTTYLPGLWADTSAAEAANTYPVDLLSNGFKFRDGGVNQNANGDTYVYAAFAENPFNNSLAR